MAEPTLEGLPTELKILILFRVPDGDISTLKSLVLASPEYHQAYLAVRHEVLGRLVKQRYSGFLDLAEALTAVRSEGVHFSCQTEDVISLLDKWRRRNEIRELGRSSSNQLDEPNGLEEIIKLLHFHKILCFFLKDFSINAPRPPWIHPVQWKNEYLPLHLSLSEKRRFLRAMCRFQIVKNTFGDKIYCFNVLDCECGRRRSVWQLGEPDHLRHIDKIHGVGTLCEMAYRLFYGTIPPWEHEEMGGVFNYLISKIKIVGEEIVDDLRRLSKNTPCTFFWDILPKEQRPPGLCDIEVESDLVHFPKHYDGLAGLGPEFMYRILHMDRLSRRNIVCLNTNQYWAGPFIGLNIGLSWDFKFPFTDPADLYEPANFEQFWSTLPPLEQPTEGWKKAWLLPHDEGNILEESMHLERRGELDWEWGYALWDEGRLKEWKAPLLVEDHGR